VASTKAATPLFLILLVFVPPKGSALADRQSNAGASRYSTVQYFRPLVVTPKYTRLLPVARMTSGG
jgi:hypothetical protein